MKNKTTILKINDVTKNDAYLRINIAQQIKGYLIMDSYNNPFFPINQIQIDTSEFNTSKLKKYFHEEYGGKPNDLFLPWHFTIETINSWPYIINTRPFNYKTIIEDYEDFIVIMIIGDSNRDIYTQEFYKNIANFCINPFRFIPSFNILNQRKDFKFFTGKNFNKDLLFKWIHG